MPLNSDTKEIWVFKGTVTDPEAHGFKAELGDPEWQFSDGPDGTQGASEDFLDLAEGLKAYSGYTIHWDEPASPSPTEGHWITVLEGDSDEIPAGAKLACITPAAAVDVDYVLNAPTNNPFEGRSDWVWIRFADGTLALGLFPRGETYLAISEPGKAPFWP